MPSSVLPSVLLSVLFFSFLSFFLFHATCTPFLIRWCFLYRKVSVCFLMLFCGPVFLCGLNSCEMSVDVLLTDRLPVYFPVKMIWLRFGNGCKCVWNITHWPDQLEPLRLPCIELTWTCVWTLHTGNLCLNLVSLQVTLRAKQRRS